MGLGGLDAFHSTYTAFVGAGGHVQEMLDLPELLAVLAPPKQLVPGWFEQLGVKPNRRRLSLDPCARHDFRTVLRPKGLCDMCA